MNELVGQDCKDCGWKELSASRSVRPRPFSKDLLLNYGHWLEIWATLCLGRRNMIIL